jgi:hypothetical protein
MDFQVETTKHRLAELANLGTIGPTLMATLFHGEVPFPLEFEILDYKEMLGTTRLDVAELVRDAVAFHNSFGGYLVFGVKEVHKGQVFEVVGIDPGVISVESVRKSIEAHTGHAIPVQISHESVTVGGSKKNISIVYISRRKTGGPIDFIKDGPGRAPKNDPIFRAADIVFRKGDECRFARGREVLELRTPRPSFSEVLAQPIRVPGRKILLDSNLPDRNFICPRFLGRKAVLDQLWEWLGDDLSRVKVLAGAGGLGKTSVAYEFAASIASSEAVEFERVVWATAKKQQYSAAQGRYVPVPNTAFSSYSELVDVLCSHFSYSSEEISTRSEKQKLKLLVEAMQVWPSLIVIDDVDSLSEPEQRLALELALSLPSSKSRLLLTTRHNKIYSGNIAISLPGLDLNVEFPELLRELATRFNLSPMQSPQISEIHSVTGGNPLYAESVLRQIKLTRDYHRAIKEWKGKDGEAVRQATLERELTNLSPESSRVLLALSFLQEASNVELAKATGYTTRAIDSAIDELSSLFLLESPPLAQVAVHLVPENVRLVVQSSRQQLASDHAKLESTCASLRSHAGVATGRTDARRGQGADPKVGAAIGQAMVFLRSGDAEKALETIVDARKKGHGKHPDLMVMEARIRMNPKIGDAANARDLVRGAYELKSARPELFDIWYQSELELKHYVGALEAANARLTKLSGGEREWLANRASALFGVASNFASAGNYKASASHYWDSREDLLKLLKSFSSELEEQELEETLCRLDEHILEVTRRGAKDVFDVLWQLADVSVKILRGRSSEPFPSRPMLLAMFQTEKWLEAPRVLPADLRSNLLDSLGSLESLLKSYRADKGANGLAWIQVSRLRDLVGRSTKARDG